MSMFNALGALGLGGVARLFRGADAPPAPPAAASERDWLRGALESSMRSVQHMQTQQLRAASQRSFESAETPAWTASWPTMYTDINDDLAQQLPALRARSHGLARNNEWASRYLIQLEDNVLGPDGVRLQMRVKLPSGEPDRDTNARIERGYKAWCKRGVCETSGHHTWREAEALLLGSLARAGEMLYQLRPGAGPMGFQLRLYNPAVLDATLHRTWQGGRVRMGVELNDDAARKAFWVRGTLAGDTTSSDAMQVGRHVRVPAENMRHFFAVEEVDQLRGTPWLSVGARRLWLLRDFEEAAAVASSNAAKRQGFFFSPTGEAPPGFADTIVSKMLEEANSRGQTLTADEIQEIQAAAEKFNTVMPGQFDTLPQGYQFQKFESAWPNIDSSAHIKQQIRGWSAARGTSYHTLGNDLEAVNYSSSQVGIIDEREHYKAIQRKFISWVHEEIWPHVLNQIVLRDSKLKPSKIDEYLEATAWQARRWAPIDPLKHAKTQEIKLANGTTTRRKEWLEDGQDPDEMMAEYEGEVKRFGALTPVPVGMGGDASGGA